MRGHEEASGTKYVPKEVMEYWAEKDPVINYEKYLIENKIYSKSEVLSLESIKLKLKKR